MTKTPLFGRWNTSGLAYAISSGVYDVVPVRADAFVRWADVGEWETMSSAAPSPK